MTKLKVLLLCWSLGSLTQTGLSQKSGKANDADFSVYKNFDFLPGEKTLFFDDFSKGLTHWSVVEWDVYEEDQKGRVTTVANIPGKWYYMPRKGTSKPKSVGALPNQFTLEYDLFTDDNVSEHEGGILNVFVKEKGLDINEYSFHFDGSPQIKIDIKPAGDMLYLGAWREYGYGKGMDDGDKVFEDLKEKFWTPNQVHRISISRDGPHVKAYVNQNKVIDLPNALPPQEVYTLLLCNNLWISGYYISNLRLATGSPQPALELRDNKPYVTQNILFDVNSDKIKPSSYQTLRQVAQAIKQIDDKILIIGHTDSDGDPDKNIDLSKRRAASVKNALVKEFGIDATKLETDGKGQNVPIDDNDTPQGKANNRRVEFSVIR